MGLKRLFKSFASRDFLVFCRAKARRRETGVRSGGGRQDCAPAIEVEPLLGFSRRWSP